MLGENLIIGEDFQKVAQKLTDLFLKQINGSAEKFIITVAGESGSGKSGISKALADNLTQAGVKTLILQQDDYFLYPPQTNEEKRRANLSWVGIKEVNLELLQHHLNQIKENKDFVKPLVIFNENQLTEEQISLAEVKVVIVEGTYTSVLENVDRKLFIDRVYTETRKERIIKAREVQDEFLEKVLEIEHGVIKEHKAEVDVVITNSFGIKTK